MFTKLGDLAYVRTRTEALGFYIAWLIAIVVGGIILGPVLGMIFGIDSAASGYTFGVRVGATVAMLTATTLTVMIANARKVDNQKLFIAAAGTVVLSVLGGGFLGLLIPAYLSTRRSRADVQFPH